MRIHNPAFGNVRQGPLVVTFFLSKFSYFFSTVKRLQYAIVKVPSNPRRIYRLEKICKFMHAFD